MEITEYVRALRRHGLLVVVVILACAGAAAALAWTRTPIYAATTQLFVSTSGGVAADLSQTYQGGLFSQQRVRSYARIVPSPTVIQPVIQELGLRDSVRELQSQIRASVPVDTVLIDVTVRNRSPQRAKAIADAVARQFSRFVGTLETPEGGRTASVKVSITSPARVPTDPVAPRKALYLALGGLLGIALGIGAAVLRAALDNRIRDAEEAGAIAGAPVLAKIAEDPKARRRPLVVTGDGFAAGAEGYRRLRTNLRALGVHEGPRSFVVCSPLAAEGKTLIAANLGLAFAEAGHRVVLVDADLRRPKLAALMGLASPDGLAGVLSGRMSVEDALTKHSTLPLEVLASGPRPDNPSELLGSERLADVLAALTARADVVIVDSPALLPVTDAAILARATAGAILVARVGTTSRVHFEIATEALRAVGAEVLGVVLNSVRARDTYSYGKSGYAPDGGRDRSATDVMPVS